MPKNFRPKVNDVHAKTTNKQWVDILSGGGFCPFTIIQYSVVSIKRTGYNKRTGGKILPK